MEYKPVKLLNDQTAKKIAAGEVIERPASVVRELLDNALDANASKIIVSLVDGGLREIVVSDDGFGMSQEDLALCTETHSTSKISSIDDLLRVTSLGFRGEALASIKAVSELEIISTQKGPVAHRFFNGAISKASFAVGTRVTVKNLFYNFPARKKFLKTSSTETKMCKTTFIEKALTHPHVEMVLKNNDSILLHLPKVTDYKERAIQTLKLQSPVHEKDAGFVEIYASGETFRASIVLGLPEIAKPARNYMYIFVNGRRIDEYGLLQALDYGAAPFFPNGTHPVALAFLEVRPDTIDFNIHPAKREAKFSDYGRIHSSLSSTVASFYKSHTILNLKKNFASSGENQGLELYDSELSENAGGEGVALDNFATGENRAELFEHSSSAPATGSSPSRFSGGGFGASSNKPTSATSYPNLRKVDNVFSVADVATSYNGSLPQSAVRYAAPLDIPTNGFKFLGQVAGTFLAVEKNGQLYLIDQHAAHERILFEELKKRSGEKQELLVPYRLEAESAEEENFLEKFSCDLSKQGFEIEKIANYVWSVNTVPVLWKGTEKELSEDIKKALFSSGNVLHEILALSACRAACKDGDVLSADVAIDLVKKTFALEEPLCPHGRPLWVVITREELFKRIKRT